MNPTYGKQYNNCYITTYFDLNENQLISIIAGRSGSEIICSDIPANSFVFEEFFDNHMNVAIQKSKIVEKEYGPYFEEDGS